GPRALVRLARLGLLPVSRLAAEHFRGDAAARLLAGNTMHTDLGPDDSGGAIFAWLLCGLAQSVGWPCPEGGAGALSAALVRRLRARGGVVRCGAPAVEVIVRRGRAVGVRLAGGDGVGARRAVLAAVSAPDLYGKLLAAGHLPARVLVDLPRFEW